MDQNLILTVTFLLKFKLVLYDIFCTRKYDVSFPYKAVFIIIPLSVPEK